MGQSRSSHEHVWFYAAPSGQFGPYSLVDLKIKLSTISDAQDLFVWRDGMVDWQRAFVVPELRPKDVRPPSPSFIQRRRNNSLSIARSFGLFGIGIFVLVVIFAVADDERNAASGNSQAQALNLSPVDEKGPVSAIREPTIASIPTPTPPADKPGVTRNNAKTTALSAAAIAAVIVQTSRQRYYASGHPCACPDDVTRSGRSCGGNSAYSRPGGAAPLCYVSDVSAEMIAHYRANTAPTAAVR
jgi:GYF domain 2